MYKGYWGIVSRDTKCPDPAASTAKAEEAELRNKEIAAWKDVDQRATGAILLMLSTEECTALRAHRTSGSALYAAIRQRHVQEKPVGLVLPAQSHVSGITWFYVVFHFDDHPWLLIQVPLMWHHVVLL